MDMGGLIGESKIDILNSIAQEFKPKTIFFKNVPSSEKITENLNEALIGITKSKMDFPLIIKPNVGERGNDVEKINNLEEFSTYLTNHSGDLIIQEFVDYPIELGVLYFRFPNDKSGKVSSITMKKFLTVVGDGKSSIYELLENSTRARFQLHRLKQKMPDRLKEIPEKNQEVLIEPIGNHCRGTAFINRNDLIKDEITPLFDKISSTINGFYYGRFDLKIKSFDDLYSGNNLKIMELNGISSEPAHIYDSNYKLIQAYKDILYHWRVMFEIYQQNKAKSGI
jgi:hypothetical protein